MSGIAGIVRFDGQPVFQGQIQSMLDQMPYRGPDGHTSLWSAASPQSPGDSRRSLGMQPNRAALIVSSVNPRLCRYVSARAPSGPHKALSAVCAISSALVLA